MITLTQPRQEAGGTDSTIKRAVFDFVVAGGGSAGCVLANRLSEDPSHSVLLVEAGGSDNSLLFHIPAGFAKMTKGVASWGWSTVPQEFVQGRQIWFTQAKVIGGGSSINAQVYARGNALDYDAWADEFGCAGWSYRDVLPYFKRAEGNECFDNAYHGTGGPLGVSMPRATLPVCEAFIRAAQEFGMPFNHDFNGSRQRGVGYYQLTQRNVRRCSASTGYLWPVRSRPNLTIMTGTRVHRINVEGQRATGVEIATGSERMSITARREVVVTSGAIGTPYLLMHSGIGPASHLERVGVKVRHDLPGVGSNLQDHINLCVIAELTGPHSYDGYQRLDRTIRAGLQYFLFRSGPAAASFFETGAFWFTNAKANSPDIQFHLGQGSGIEKGIAKVNGSGITLNSAFLRPESRGTVRLASADRNRAPLIDPKYWSATDDWARSVDGLDMAREILAQPALSKFVRREILPGPDIRSIAQTIRYACRIAKTDHHPVGTCRMGHDELAVVTPDLKVHGIEGLRICDASVMPRICSANTNAATIMIAEKASDHILGRPLLEPAELERDV